MSGKYSSFNNNSSISSIPESTEDLEEMYDVYVSEERKMVADNLEKIIQERTNLRNRIANLSDPDEIEEETEELNQMDSVIQMHYELEKTLTDMGEMFEAFKSASLPKQLVLDTLNTINENRNNLKDNLGDAGYPFW